MELNALATRRLRLCSGKFALFCDSYLESNGAKNSAGGFSTNKAMSCNVINLQELKWKCRSGGTCGSF
ncbi:unnamed protein product [Urochloa humidicola]